MLLFLYKGFNATGLAYLQLAVSAMVLGIICTVFLIYGLRVLSRPQDFEIQKRHRMPSTLSERMMHRSFNIETLSDDADGVPVVTEPKYGLLYPESGHAGKIKKILFVAVSLSIIVITGQMYMAVQRTHRTQGALVCQRHRMCRRQVESQPAPRPAGCLRLGGSLDIPRYPKKRCPAATPISRHIRPVLSRLVSYIQANVSLSKYFEVINRDLCNRKDQERGIYR